MQISKYPDLAKVYLSNFPDYEAPTPKGEMSKSSCSSQSQNPSPDFPENNSVDHSAWFFAENLW